MSDKKQPKKRGRKPKPKNEKKEKPPPKKRGRKPKGGKIINKEPINTIIASENKQNIILHLKCNSNSINKNDCSIFSASNYNPIINEPSSFKLNNNSKINNLNYQDIIQNNIDKKIENKVIKVLEEKEEIKENINIKEIPLIKYIKSFFFKIPLCKKKSCRFIFDILLSLSTYT